MAGSIGGSFVFRVELSRYQETDFFLMVLAVVLSVENPNLDALAVVCLFWKNKKKTYTFQYTYAFKSLVNQTNIPQNPIHQDK